MPTVSNHEEIGQEFLVDHPIGTIVSAGSMQTWVKEHANGSMIGDDLHISDPARRIAALRRHLNDGGASSNLDQENRFVLEIEDARAKTFVVRRHSDVAHAKATDAIGKSVMQAMSPLRAGERAVDAVKLDELPDIERKALEMARENVAAMKAAIRPTFEQEVDRIWIAEMARRGIPAEIAYKVREALPNLNKVQKLLRAIA